MKVSELRSLLLQYPQDAPVVALWDGGWANIEGHSLKTDLKGKKVVEFDVEDHGTYDDTCIGSEKSV